MSDSLEVHFVSENVASGALGSVVLNVYRGAPTATEMRRLADRQRAVHRRIGRSLGVLSLATGQLSLPEGETREVAARLRAEMESMVAASATAIVGTGFWVAGAISVINTIALVSRTKNPSRAFRTRDAAIAWLLDCVEGPSAASVAAALEQLEVRSRMDSPA